MRVTITAMKERMPSEIWVMVCAALAVALGYGIVAPVLPQFATSFGVSMTAATSLVSVFAGMRLAFATFQLQYQRILEEL